MAPEVANTVNKKLIQSNRNDFIANGQNSKLITNDKQITKHDDIWEEAEDDDDDDIADDHYKQQIVKPSEPVKDTPIINNTQQVR
jgi:hypothetical protein